jgi:4-hydroxy-3-methylbut-2-en-1-yl diphosphate reductase
VEIRKASVQGFCFGVAITVKKAEEAIASRGEVTTLGHVVHNPQMVESLQSRGLRNAQSVDEVDAGALFVRAHGLPVDVFQKAKSKGLEIIDATCPMVTKIHVQAEKLKTDGYKIVVIGDPAHPEVKGTLSHVPGAWCIQSVDDVAKLPRSSKVGVVVQSTWSGQGFTKIVQALAAKYYEVRGQHDLHRHAQPARRSAAARARRGSDGRRRRKDVGEHQAFGRTLRIARRARLPHRECSRTSP